MAEYTDPKGNTIYNESDWLYWFHKDKGNINGCKFSEIYDDFNENENESPCFVKESDAIAWGIEYQKKQSIKPEIKLTIDNELKESYQFISNHIHELNFEMARKHKYSDRFIYPLWRA